jgi:hypothetical protein
MNIMLGGARLPHRWHQQARPFSKNGHVFPVTLLGERSGFHHAGFHLSDQIH